MNVGSNGGIKAITVTDVPDIIQTALDAAPVDPEWMPWFIDRTHDK